jgi:hypothetical protein
VVGVLILLMGGIRTHLNAARTSAAGEGSTEPLIDLIESLILCQKTPDHIRGRVFFNIGWGFERAASPQAR